MIRTQPNKLDYVSIVAGFGILIFAAILKLKQPTTDNVLMYVLIGAGCLFINPVRVFGLLRAWKGSGGTIPPAPPVARSLLLALGLGATPLAAQAPLALAVAHRDGPRAAAADTAFSWTVQSRVHSLNFTCVRTAPAAASACFATHQCCDKGTITAGPTLDAVTNATFWKVAFDTGSSGWARQTNLALDTLFKPPPPPPTARVTFLPISPTNVTQTVGDSITWQASPLDSAGKPLACPVVWASTNPAVATIDPTGGNERAVGVGVDTVLATCGGLTRLTSLTVRAALPPVELAAATFTLSTAAGPLALTLPNPWHILTGTYSLWVADSTGKRLTVGTLKLERP